MTPDVLRALTVQLERKTACATVTDVRFGRQTLLVKDGENPSETGDLILDAAQKTAVLRRISADKSGLDSDLFVRVYAPPPRMIIVGAVHIAQFLAPMAALAGFDVTVIDPREAFVGSGNLSGVTVLTAWPDEGMKAVNPDSRTAIVTLTHDPKLDDPALSAALRSPAFYIGALGSKKPIPRDCKDWRWTALPTMIYRASMALSALRSTRKARRKSRYPLWHK